MKGNITNQDPYDTDKYDQWGNTSANNITFNEYATIEGNITALRGQITSAGATNNITFEKSGVIKGNIKTESGGAYTDANRQKVKNTIIFGKENTRDGDNNQEQTAKIEGNITANRSANSIIFNTKTNTIKGVIQGQNSSFTDIKGSKIANSSLTIDGKIDNFSASTLTLDAQKSELKITGKLSSQGNSTTTITTEGKLTLGAIDIWNNVSTTTIKAEGTENQIGQMGTTSRIQAGDQSGGGAKNIFIFGKAPVAGQADQNNAGNSSTKIYADILVGNGDNLGGASQGLNSLTFNTQTNLIEGNIRTVDGKTLIQAQGKSLEINGGILEARGNSDKTVNSIVAGEGSKLTIRTIQTSNGMNNISLKGAEVEIKANQAPAVQVPADQTNKTLLSANISNRGYTNIILENASWTSYNESNPSASKSGVVTTYSGETNIVLRNTFKTQNGAQAGAGRDLVGYLNALSTLSTDTSNLNTHLIHSMGGKTNIVLEKRIQEKFDINYSAGEVNLIFAASSEGSDKEFIKAAAANQAANIDQTKALEAEAASSIKDSTKIAENKVLGKTYKDGIKLTLKDMQVKVGNKSVSLLETFGSHFTTSQNAPVRIETQVMKDGHHGTITGLAAGSLSALASSAPNAAGGRSRSSRRSCTSSRSSWRCSTKWWS